MRQRGEDAGPVAGVGLAADAAAMLHAAVDAPRVVHDAAPGASLDVAYEADAAALVLEAGVVEPWAGGGPGRIRCVAFMALFLRNRPPDPDRVETRGRTAPDGGSCGIRIVLVPADPDRVKLANMPSPDSPALEARETGSGGTTAPIRIDGADARL